MISLLLLFAMFMTAPAPALPADLDHGKMLVQQHCTKCHDSRVFTRPDRRIGSLEALKNQVERCERNASVHWAQSDVDDVVVYLDADFYKFGGGGTGSAQK